LRFSACDGGGDGGDGVLDRVLFLFSEFLLAYLENIDVRVTYSIAAFCMASAPYLPWPKNASGGLWYTEASDESSVSNVSRSCGGSEPIVDVIGGLSESTIF
jgi:hypothetical protein